MSSNNKWAVLFAVVTLLGIGVAGAASTREVSPECASMARVVAKRNHSILDGAEFQSTLRQSYAVCLSDPAAFRRIIRRSATAA